MRRRGSRGGGFRSPVGPELVHGFLTGLAGTAAMTATTEVQKRMRHGTDIPVDYDATKHVAIAASQVVRITPRDHRQMTALYLLTHWGYGSAVAIAHRVLVARTDRPNASAAVFYVGCQSMAFVLFPVLGETPRPWRWRRDVLVSSLAHHAVYVTVVALTDRELPRVLGHAPRATG